MNYEYLIDSSVWVEYFSGSEKGNKSKDIIESKKVAISIIAIAELADKFAREGKSFENYLLFIQNKAAILPITVSISLEAAKIKLKQRKKQPKFGLADALQLATSREKVCMFVTTDNDFVEMAGVLLVR